MNTEKRNINKKVGVLNFKFSECLNINALLEWIIKVKKDGAVKLDWDVIDYKDEVECTAYTVALETDQEYEFRMKHDKLVKEIFKESVDRIERMQYEKLKAKFESPNPMDIVPDFES